MRAYRTKPATVHAVQWHDHGDNVAVTPAVNADGSPRCEMGETCDHCNQAPHVHGWLAVPGGAYLVCPGDWIVLDELGKFRVLKPSTFALLYESAEEQPKPFNGIELDRLWLDELPEVGEELMRDLVLTGTATYTIGIDPAEGEKNGIMRRLLNKVAMRDLFANVPRKLD